jgi:hypothetical protein
MNYHTNDFDEPDLTEEMIGLYISCPTLAAILDCFQAEEDEQHSASETERALSPDIYEDSQGEATDEMEETIDEHDFDFSLNNQQHNTISPKFASITPNLRFESYNVDSGVDMDFDDTDDTHESNVCSMRAAILEKWGSASGTEEIDRRELVKVWKEVTEETLTAIAVEWEWLGRNDEDYDGDGEAEMEGSHRRKRCRRH